MFRHVDGVFDEHGDNPIDNMKVTALNTLAMPAVIWNHGGGKSDEYLQRHLYFGVNCNYSVIYIDIYIQIYCTYSVYIFLKYACHTYIDIYIQICIQFSHTSHADQAWFRSPTTTTQFTTPPREQRGPSKTTALCLHSFARRFG